MFKKILVKFSSLLYCIPGNFSKKLVMIGNILLHDWRIDLHFRSYKDIESFCRYRSFDELPDMDTLDERSQDVIRRFFGLVFLCNVFDGKRYFYNYSGLLEKVSRKQRRELAAKRKEFKRKYGKLASPSECMEDCACCFSHGLTLLSDKVKSYVRNKLFIDAGAFTGDSAISFLPYEPEKILSFEASPTVFGFLQENHSKIKELSAKCDIIQSALGDKTGELRFCDDGSCGCHEDENAETVVPLTTIDDYLKDHTAPVGLIKADIEGMALKMIIGAEKTIRRDHPLLLIAVYHCAEEMFGIREQLKAWNLNYKFRYEFLEPETTQELTLIAYPQELD